MFSKKTMRCLIALTDSQIKEIALSRAEQFNTAHPKAIAQMEWEINSLHEVAKELLTYDSCDCPNVTKDSKHYEHHLDCELVTGQKEKLAQTLELTTYLKAG